MKIHKDKLHDISFPSCARNCSAIEHFGACECDSLCLHKFNKNGDRNPLCLNCGLDLDPACDIELPDVNKTQVCGPCFDKLNNGDKQDV